MLDAMGASARQQQRNEEETQRDERAKRKRTREERDSAKLMQAKILSEREELMKLSHQGLRCQLLLRRKLDPEAKILLVGTKTEKVERLLAIDSGSMPFGPGTKNRRTGARL